MLPAADDLFHRKNGVVIFTVRAVPRGSKSEVVGSHAGALKIRLAAPPVDGAANAELVKFLAKFFAVSKSAVRIVGGATAKIKQIEIVGLNPDKLKQI